MGVQGVSEYEREALILSSSLGASQGELARRAKRRWPGPLASFWASRKKLAARRRRNPPAKNHRSGAPGRGPGQPLLPLRGNSPSRALRGAETCPLIRHGFAVPPFPIPSVAARHLPLIRGVGPQGGRLKKSGRRNSLPSPYHSNSKKFGDLL